MRLGIFAFILLSALVHGIVIGYKSDWLFNLHNSQEQGRSTLNIELLAQPKKMDKVATLPKPKPEFIETANKTAKKEKLISVKTSTKKTTSIRLEKKQIKSSAKPSTVQSSLPTNNTSTQKKHNDNPAKQSTTQIQALLNNQLNKHFYYPKAAQRKNRQGSVLLTFSISPLGKIENIHVSKSSGFKILDKAAIKALKEVDAREDLAKALNGDSITHTLPITYKLTR